MHRRESGGISREGGHPQGGGEHVGDQPDARPQGLPRRPDVPGPHRDAGPGHLRGGVQRGEEGSRRPPGGHDTPDQPHQRAPGREGEA